jgi:hypothetical protein
MDHPELVVAETVLWPSWDLGLYFGAPLSRGRPGFGAFFPTHAYQKRAEIMVTGFQVFAGPRWGLPEDRHMDRAVASAGFHFDCARGRTLGGACLPAAFRTGLFARCEQAPDPENRVVLDERRDAFDNRLPELQWRLTGTDYASFRTATLELGKVLYADGIGRIRPLLPDRLPADLRTVYGFSLSPEELDAIHDRRTPVIRVWGHHMGATRMADTPARGVVDSDCRVHGVANLYVGGCSVFPTGGAANPTLTIVALALRLATHLRAVAGA